ncbi:PGN_0703 family putative restriction endonuclease [Bradyrhizobium japonicum]|uniref:PGN_0703 family putative restriction endonuclease n=1 Tax=Bradyrhizobium japonicum TaxID=375 RepID=UPI003B6756E8
MNSLVRTPDRAALPRIPLVPEEVARRNKVFFEIDTRFRRAARLLQCLWLKDRGIPTGHHVRGDGDDAITMELHSYLSRDAARAGRNFLSPEIHALARHELLMREEGAAIDEDRLFGNALSSMPLTFNLFGPMALDLKLATNTLRQLLPGFVHQVTGFIFEHSPGRRQERFLNDGTAWDLAIHVITPEGEEGTIFIEVKYSEDMTGPAARLRDRYDEVSRSVGLFVDPDSPMLRSLALEQLWREHMLAQLTVDQGLTPRAMFITIGPKLNRRVMAAFRVYENELINADDQDANRVAFQAFTLESFIDALSEAGADGLARDLWGRYCDFERVYHLALGEYLEKSSSHPAPLTPPSKDVEASLQKATTGTTAKRATKSRAQKALGAPQ